MPICHICDGTGQKEVPINVTKRCPECSGSVTLPDGSRCKRCQRTGEIATGRRKIILDLCDNCWGSGEISHLAVNVWFSLRVIPLSLLILGLGAGFTWFIWGLTDNVPLITTPMILSLLTWGGMVLYYTDQLHQFGPIPALRWFLLRAGSSSIIILGVGAAVTWIVATIAIDPRIIISTGLTVLGVWAMAMVYFIIFDSPGDYVTTDS